MRESTDLRARFEQFVQEYTLECLHNSPLIKAMVSSILSKLMHIDDLQGLLNECHGKEGLGCVQAIVDRIGFSIDTDGQERIPSEGRLIVVANHPSGAIDGFALVQCLAGVRDDVNIIASPHVLEAIPSLGEMVIPMGHSHGYDTKPGVRRIKDCLDRDEAVIILPAGSVSGLTLRGIQDGTWRKGVITLARSHQTPISPVFIDAENSMLFYLINALSKRLRRLLIPHELFNKGGQNIRLHVGNPIPSDFWDTDESLPELANRLREHVYSIGARDFDSATVLQRSEVVQN